MQLINATFLFFSSVRFAATNCASALPVGGPIKWNYTQTYPEKKKKKKKEKMYQITD